MVRRRLILPFIDVIEDDEVVADEEINQRKWKSYHEIDVKQNMGYGRYIHKIIQNIIQNIYIYIYLARPIATFMNVAIDLSYNLV